MTPNYLSRVKTLTFCSEINENMDKVNDWSNKNKLKLNVDKTNIILVENHQNHFQLQEEIKMKGSIFN